MKRKQYSKVFNIFTAVILLFGMLMPTVTFAQPNMLDKQSNENTHFMDTIQKQEVFQKQKPTLHGDLQGLKGDNQIDVIVHLSENPVALEKGKKVSHQLQFTKADERRVQNKVKAQQQSFLNNLSTSKIQTKTGYSYSNVLNGVALTLKSSDVEKLLALPGVIYVEPDVQMVATEAQKTTPQANLSMDTSISHLEIEKLWEQGLEGQGIKVGVIDTGIDYDHPEFADSYKGGKNYVIHDGSYLNPREDNDPFETSPIDRPAHMPPVDASGHTYETSHGTHVAGTIAAKGSNTYGIKGLAPKVELYAYRVLGAYGSGNMSWVIKGIEDAVRDDMDVINLSLGTTSNSSTTADSIAINNAMLAGVVSVVSSGNSGPNRETVGSPGTASLGITVGNSTNPETIKASNVHLKVGDNEEALYMDLMGWKYGEEPADVLVGTFDIVAIPGIGEPADFRESDVSGKIALIARGGIPFVDKIAAAKDAGAVGTLIHNSSDGSNTPGVSNVYLGDSFAFIPSYDMSYTDGQTLRDALAANNGNGTITFDNFSSDKTIGDEINDSSSRGPTSFHSDIKPDVSAPGTNIMSSVAAYQKDFPEATYDEAYERYTGTSMAAPHISSIAALLIQKNPDWSPFDVKVALSNTANVLSDSFDVYSQGAGRVNPVKAVAADTRAYHVMSEDINGQTYTGERGTVSFGYLDASTTEVSTYNEDIVIENLSDTPTTFTITVGVLKKPTGDMSDVTVTTDQTEITVTDQASFTLEVTLPPGVSQPNDEVQGYITIENGTSLFSLPFAASIGQDVEEGIKSMNLEGYHVSPNGDGKADSTNANIEFHDMQFYSLLYFWDALNPDGGIDGSGTVGDIWEEVGIEAGVHSIPVSNQILDPQDSSKTLTIPDGVYTVELGTLTYESNEDYYANAGPLFIVSTPPTITLDNVANGAITGIVDSKYFEFEEPLNSIYNIGYDAREFLDANYMLINKETNKQDSGTLELAEDGSFEVEVSLLGNYTLEVTVNDAAQNQASASLEINAIKNVLPSEDEYLIAGDEVKISFTSDYTNAVASYSVLFPEAKKANLQAVNMVEVEQGKYEGTWKVPSHVTLDGAEILVTLTNELGQQISQKATGRLHIFSQAIERVSGNQRYDTAIEVSKKGWDFADTVILARGDDYADALAGVPLAYELNAPILLTKNDKLIEQTVEEIKRLKPKKIILLGGVNALSNNVETAANALAEVERINGDNRIETAVKIAEKMTTKSIGKAVVVNGYNFPDAMSIAAHAAKEGLPILLTKATKLSEDTKEALESLSVEETIIIGGETAISSAVAEQLPGATRLSGTDRYQTNVEVIEHFGVTSKSLYVATGKEFADALTSSVLAAKKDSAILLLHNQVPQRTAEYIKQNKTKHLTVLGGNSAVDQKVYEVLKGLLEK